MPLYEYACPYCKWRGEIRHSMAETGEMHECPACGETLARVLTPTHHRWPSNYAPGMEESGQRMFLDPERQARVRDNLARMKDERGDDGD